MTVDALSNRHTISPYVYGGAYPQDAPTITDSGLSVVRWGGNATSRYNWQLFTYNAANDYYFEDFNYSEIGDANSTQFITDVKSAGSHPLMTMVMLPWVAKSAENGSNGHWSFSVAKYGSQCGVDPFNTDAGDGLKTDCSTILTANPNDANVPLLDQPGTSDPPGSVYRNQWAAALASAFGSGPHFYNMDNEIDIWGSTHRDVHPAPTAYNEMRDTFVTEARKLKGWDAKAMRFGPVSCCWWFYWNGANGSDKGAHAGVDLLPWWLNEVYWEDKVAGLRSVEVLDVHAYPDGPDTSTWTQAQKQALAARIYRDYWDPTYVSESGSINQNWATFIQPNKTIPFPHSAHSRDSKHDLSWNAHQLHRVECGIRRRIRFFDRPWRRRCLRHFRPRADVSRVTLDRSFADESELPRAEAFHQLRRPSSRIRHNLCLRHQQWRS